MKNKIILYRPNEAAEHIEVRFENETIWLTLNQIASLFNKDKSVVSRHLRNIYREGELIEEETVAKNATVQNESGRTVRRTIDYYNLDAIISVGYRVNSKQGTQFRIWATSVLREYLLKGYALNQRVDRIENNLENLSKEVSKITLQLKTNELPTQGVFFNGQIFDAYELMSRIIRSAKKEIILIDNYIDESVMTHLSKRAENVDAIIYTKSTSRVLQLDLERYNSQYPPINIRELRESHDRFIIIDRMELYHIGASLKDLGKKWFAFSKLDDTLMEFILEKINEN
jgi:hypothetical protein